MVVCLRAILLCLISGSAISAGAAVADDVSISLHRGTFNNRPVIVVAVTNQSPVPICIRSDALGNPYSHEMDLRLRDNRGRPVRLREPGFIPPPIEGIVSIEPGRTVRGRYYLDSRFALRSNFLGSNSQLIAQSTVSYDYCHDADPRRARSAWASI